jgi:hypothetical protein
MEEHVLDAIQIVEDTRQHAFTEIAQQKGEYLYATFEDLLAKVKELFISDTALF